MMQIKRSLLAIGLSSLMLFTLAACSNFPWQERVEQGHHITAKQLEQLKVGQNKTQVIYLLGSPGLQDPFHTNRWDYVYTDSYNKAPAKVLTLLFTGTRLTHIYGNYPGLKPYPQQGN